MNTGHEILRARIRVKGIVQGVGFRPFIHNLAKRHGLKGFCLNDSEGVLIEVEGQDSDIETFIMGIKESPPPLSKVDEVSVEKLPPAGFEDFRIKESLRIERKFSQISPDVSVCEDCVYELEDSKDRRYLYPFINCTNCGPRYSITLGIPYDRKNTTMNKFTMCPECLSEYQNPESRRFHAEPNACPECGPEVWLIERGKDPSERKIKGRDAVEETIKLLRHGAIVAIKGIGGFHLACDAENSKAVALLRERKRKSNKPFALMARDTEAASIFCAMSKDERDALLDRRRPIVILKKKTPNPIAEFVSSATDSFGVMLPYTPLHRLILKEFIALVMTSGNLAEEAIVADNDAAINSLSGMADYFLFHDRDIYMRVDDSIVRFSGGKKIILRRSRGYVPDVVPLFGEAGEALACGGEMKNTFTFTKGGYAIISQHIGDLTNDDAFGFYNKTMSNLKNTFNVSPKVVAYDMHPDYLTTDFALDYGVPSVPVQHHHAHIVSVMAEKGLKGLVIGIAFDGTGYGTDGCVWGGEFLLASRGYFIRKGQIKYTGMPGGEKAIKEPWRMAVSYLYSLYGPELIEKAAFFAKRFEKRKIETVINMCKTRINTPLTSSCGRLFDAVASILGLNDYATFEAEAAICLEKAASLGVESDKSYHFVMDRDQQNEYLELDVLPVIGRIVEDVLAGVDVPAIAMKFHNTIADMILTAVKAINEKDEDIRQVVMSGGAFQNVLLLEKTANLLEKEGFKVFHSENVPPNDGGLSLGQAIIALERIKGS